MAIPVETSVSTGSFAATIARFRQFSDTKPAFAA
jgi:hypothetical protein